MSCRVTDQRVEPVSVVREVIGNVPDEISEPTVSECDEALEYEESEEEETFEMRM